MPGKHDEISWRNFPAEAVKPEPRFPKRLDVQITVEQDRWIREKALQMEEVDPAGRRVTPSHVIRYIVDRLMREESDRRVGIERPPKDPGTWLAVQPDKRKRK